MGGFMKKVPSLLDGVPSIGKSSFYAFEVKRYVQNTFMGHQRAHF
jgi:hypothetical protein